MGYHALHQRIFLAQAFPIAGGFFTKWGFPDNLIGKESTCNARYSSSIPGSGRSTGEEIGHPLQYSGLENSMDCIVHGVAKSWRLSDFHFTSLPSEPPGKPKNTGVGSLSPSPGELPYPGIKPGFPALQADSLPSELSRKPGFASTCVKLLPRQLGESCMGSGIFSMSCTRFHSMSSRRKPLPFD